MRMHRHIAALLVVAASTVAACAAPSDAASNESELIGDIASMTVNPDGTYDVTCKDGRHEPNVSAARLQAGDVCKRAVVVSPPPPATPWSSAKHKYKGSIYNVSSDDRYALVDFEGVGFGKFDLQTLTMAEALPRGELRATNGEWTLVTREITVPGSAAKGVAFDVHSIDGVPSVTFTRNPDPGEGSVRVKELRLCDDGVSLEWSEATGKSFRWVFSGATSDAAAPLSGTRCSEATGSFDLNKNVVAPVRKREDFRIDWVEGKYVVRQCTNGACVDVRTMPEGTLWTLVSRTGAYLLYRINDVTYRVGLQGGAIEELPFYFLRHTYTESDGRVIVLLDGTGQQLSLYDIESGQITKMELPDSVIPWDGELYALSNGVYGFLGEKKASCNNCFEGGELILFRPDGSSFYQSMKFNYRHMPRPSRVGFYQSTYKEHFL